MASAKAWAAYKEPKSPLKLVDEQADDNGWSRRQRFEYQTSPNERRGVAAGAMFANGRWTVWIYDVADEIGSKRSAAINLMFQSLLPKGYERESFAGMEAHELDAARIAELTRFIERGLEVSGVPGTARDDAAHVRVRRDVPVFERAGLGSRLRRGPRGASRARARRGVRQGHAEPDGERYIGEAALLERRKPQVPVSDDHYYGMGLMVDEYYGTPVVHHGGDLIGYHSDMMWLPEHGVGAVVLTNGDPGWLIRTGFRRKLLEVLFDGKPEADAQLASNSETFKAAMAKEFELLSVPASKDKSAALANHYRNDVLGDIRVQRAEGRTAFDFDEWQSEVGSRENPDGTTSFMTIVPGLTGLEFVVGAGEDKTLIMRDAQHEYVFDAI